MSARISIGRNFGPLTEKTLVTAADMRELGLLARERIVRRTRQGQGPDGPFAPLSAGYAKAKREALGTSSADLTVSGNMLNHLGIVAVTDTSVKLGWTQ